MPTVITRDYYLEVNGIPLATPGWECPDLSPLLDDPNVRGEDSLLPYVSGVVPHVRRITGTVYTFLLDIHGDRDHQNNTYSDTLEGILTNLDYLKANLGLASSTGDGTVPVVFRRGDLNALVGDAHFLGFKGSKTLGIPPQLIRTTFDLSIPAGRLEETGS